MEMAKNRNGFNIEITQNRNMKTEMVRARNVCKI